MVNGKKRRHTAQRATILQELCGSTDHPTAADLYQVVRRRLPKISLGTVYRNLEVLHEEGLIRKLEFSGAEARFDGTTDPHDHVRCTACGRLRDLPPLPSSAELASPPDPVGFLIQGYRLEYFGICPDCRQARAAGPPAAP